MQHPDVAVQSIDELLIKYWRVFLSSSLIFEKIVLESGLTSFTLKALLLFQQIPFWTSSKSFQYYIGDYDTREDGVLVCTTNSTER